MLANRVDSKSLPRRMVLTKCPTSNNKSQDDVMIFKIKILSEGSMVDLRMVLKGFIFYIHMDDDNALEFGSEVGHYVTFINLNDKQWLVLDCDKFYIVPDGYAYHLQRQGGCLHMKKIQLKTQTKAQRTLMITTLER